MKDQFLLTQLKPPYSTGVWPEASTPYSLAFIAAI